MKRLITGAVYLLSVAAISCAADPVVSVDTNRAISLSLTAITNAGVRGDASTLAFSDIKYLLDADGVETLTVAFRHSPQSEAATNETKTSVRTKIVFKVVTVTMEKSGKVLSVSNTGTAHKIRIESVKDEAVQPTSPGDVPKAAPEK